MSEHFEPEYNQTTHTSKDAESPAFSLAQLARDGNISYDVGYGRLCSLL